MKFYFFYHIEYFKVFIKEETADDSEAGFFTYYY
jgi:hypothetical protein